MSLSARSTSWPRIISCASAAIWHPCLRLRQASPVAASFTAASRHAIHPCGLLADCPAPAFAMKLQARDIAAFLAAPDRQTSAALLHGPDSGLIRERARVLSGTLLGQNSDPLNLIELSADQLKSDPALLRDELCAVKSHGRARRVVMLQGAGDKVTSVIESALEALKTTTYLIVESDELSASSSLRQFFEKSQQLASVACYRDEGRRSGRNGAKRS